jgi:hypothetical protein
VFSKLLVAHTMSRISELLISVLQTPFKSLSSGSGRSFFHDQTSITGLMEDHTQDMSPPFFP